MSLFKPRSSVLLIDALQVALADAFATIRSARSYASHIPHLLAFFGKDRPLASITVQEVEAYQIQALGKWKRDTVRHQIAFLSRTFRLARKSGQVRENPCSLMRLCPRGDSRRVWVHPEQIPTLFAELSDLDQEIATLLIYSGMRRGEAFKLLRTDVDLLNREFHLVDCKGNKDRSVTIHPGLLPVIQSLQARHKNPWVIPGGSNREAASDQFRCRFRRATKRVDMPAVRVHDLRRTFASWIQEYSECPLTVIRDLLGHSEVKTTQIYARHAQHTMRAYVDKMPWVAPLRPQIGHGSKPLGVGA